MPRYTGSQNRILTIEKGQVYRAPSQAGPGNDINAGSAGLQKAPRWGLASLVASSAHAPSTTPGG